MSLETGFVHFLIENKILTMAIAAILSDRIHDVTNSIYEHIILPIINVDHKANGSIDKFKDKKYIIKGRHIGVGGIYMTIIKTVIILILVYFIWHLCKKKDVLK